MMIMRCDGVRIKYLLERKGYSQTDVARELGSSIPNVCNVIWGRCTSRHVIQKIEQLLDMEPGTLEITREKTDPMIKVA